MKPTIALCMALLCCGPAAAYESEPAVPLALSAEIGRIGIEGIAIKLHGRDVEIVTSLRNGSALKVVNIAATPPQ